MAAHKENFSLTLQCNCFSIHRGHIRGIRCLSLALPCQRNKPVSRIEFGLSCLDMIIKQIHKDIHYLQMQKNRIYRMPKQVRHATPSESQLHCCLGTFPVSLEPPEAPEAQRYSCQRLNRLDKSFLFQFHQVSNVSSYIENI